MHPMLPWVTPPLRRSWRDDRLPVERARDEQAFYDRYGDAAVDWPSRLGPAVMAFQVAIALLAIVIAWR
ncbi:MAG TPA: hypothetical protein VMU33_05780 [Burkholderiaceae bacterium]|nr:hypothetical protein [Burkholderiaceae bacterium]